MHPFPLVFNVGKGYYWRPEEQGALLGMSNPVDEADTSGRYQIGFDWNFHEEKMEGFYVLTGCTIGTLFPAGSGLCLMTAGRILQ